LGGAQKAKTWGNEERCRAKLRREGLNGRKNVPEGKPVEKYPGSNPKNNMGDPKEKTCEEPNY